MKFTLAMYNQITFDIFVEIFVLAYSAKPDLILRKSQDFYVDNYSR